MPKTVRVFREGNVWVVKRDGASRAAAIRNTQKEAYLVAREIALNQGLSITVHGPNGRIQKVIYPKDRSSDGDNCFITTACVKYYGLQDDCYQLITLRWFRDNYLLKSRKNKKLVARYYECAPVLVGLMEKSPEREFLFGEVFRQINNACIEIENNEFEKAKRIYKSAIEFLFSYFQD